MSCMRRGTWVIYRGSKLRYNGWSMQVSTVSEDGARLSLVDSGTGARITNVRAASVVLDVPTL